MNPHLWESQVVAFCCLLQQTDIILSVVDHNLVGSQERLQLLPYLGERRSVTQHAFVDTMLSHRYLGDRFCLALYEGIKIDLPVLVYKRDFNDFRLLVEAGCFCIEDQHQRMRERKYIICP